VTDQLWPALPYDEWKDTYATVHMWTQVAGKVALALAPKINHSWGIAFRLSPNGLTTLPLPHGRRVFTIEFDFVQHQVIIAATDGQRRTIALEPRSVADFHRLFMKTLDEMSLGVKIWPVPVEIPDPIPFEEDSVHRSYDRRWMERYFRILVQVERLFTAARCPFVGKCSPVHFFWGAFDLAVTRFSGRPAPPREGPEWMQEAYSHEVISHGFWPGSGPILEPAFYAYAVPEPAGFKEASIAPAGAYYHRDLGEFILPYEAARTSGDPDRAILSFVVSTYDRAATLGGWDRSALDRVV
jgi:hypothetical protein